MDSEYEMNNADLERLTFLPQKSVKFQLIVSRVFVPWLFDAAQISSSHFGALIILISSLARNLSNRCQFTESKSQSNDLVLTYNSCLTPIGLPSNAVVVLTA